MAARKRQPSRIEKEDSAVLAKLLCFAFACVLCYVTGRWHERGNRITELLKGAPTPERIVQNGRDEGVLHSSKRGDER